MSTQSDRADLIVKARQEGLQTVLYKPFRSDRLTEAVEQALRSTSPREGATDLPAAPGEPAPPATEAPANEP